MKDYYVLLKANMNQSAEEIMTVINGEIRFWSTRVNAPVLEKRQEAEWMVKQLMEAEKVFKNEETKRNYDRQLLEFFKQHEQAERKRQEHMEREAQKIREQQYQEELNRKQFEERMEREKTERLEKEKAEQERKRIDAERAKIINIQDELKQIQVLFDDGNFSAASDRINIALIDYSDEFLLWKLKGFIEKRKKDYKNAKLSFEKSVELNTNDCESIIELGYLNIDLNNKQKVMEILKDMKNFEVDYSVVKFTAYTFAYLEKYDFAFKFISDNENAISTNEAEKLYMDVIQKEVDYYIAKNTKVEEITKAIQSRSKYVENNDDFLKKLIEKITKKDARKLQIDVIKVMPNNSTSKKMIMIAGLLTALNTLNLVTLLLVYNFSIFTVLKMFGVIRAVALFGCLTYLGGFYVSDKVAAQDMKNIKNGVEIPFMDIFKRSVVFSIFK